MKKTELLKMLSEITPDSKRSFSLERNEKVLIIDGMNIFIRAFAANNKHNYVGDHVGGVSGFLKSIAYVIKNENPTRCIIVFDGEGGVTNKQYLYPEYKRNRSARIINWKSFNTKDEENDSKYSELSKLIDYLKFLPLTLVAIDKMEADDAISYIANNILQRDEDSQICIMTSDKDFFQLISERVFVYDSGKKRYFGPQDVISDLSVTPENYIYYKCLTGDKSDNVKGIHGLGPKTLLKLFPGTFVGETLTMDRIIEICETTTSKSPIYQRIANCRMQLDLNFKVMSLAHPNISLAQKEELDRDIESKTPVFRKFDFIKLFYKDGMAGSIPSVETWIDCFAIFNNKI